MSMFQIYVGTLKGLLSYVTWRWYVSTFINSIKLFLTAVEILAINFVYLMFWDKEVWSQANEGVELLYSLDIHYDYET